MRDLKALLILLFYVVLGAKLLAVATAWLIPAALAVLCADRILHFRLAYWNAYGLMAWLASLLAILCFMPTQGGWSNFLGMMMVGAYQFTVFHLREQVSLEPAS